MHVGNMPERYDVALDLTGLCQNVEHEPGDLTVVADAGVCVGDLSSRLAQAGQRLPFDVPEPDRATVGGSVASNAAGFMRSSAGGIRDWVIGMKIVLADGTVTKTGGRVVKNVQGYDLHRLHTGAFGTLGVIAEVAFKLTPLPARTRTVAAVFESLDHGARAAMALFNGPFTPEACSLFCGEGAAKVIEARLPHGTAAPARVLLLVRVSGGEAGVARQVDETVKASRAAGAQAVETYEPPVAGPLWTEANRNPAGVTVGVRANLRPATAYQALADLQVAAAGRRGLVLSARADCGFGALHAGWWARADEDAREAVRVTRESVERNGGSAVIERCPPGLKRGLDVFGDAGPALAIMRRMKEQYDPGRVLNPGRFAGGI
jgi:glycolate oxidase FAD binding subunit